MSLRSILLVEVYSTALSRALAIEPGNDRLCVIPALGTVVIPALDAGIFF